MLGFKKLTPENWLEAEEIMSVFVRLSLTDGSTSNITGEEWAARFLKPQLTPSVPIEVFKLFEVARGSIAYGYFFYPLFTLAAEQLLRVAEAAVSAKCSHLGAPRRKTTTFQQKLMYLRDENVLSQHEYEEWDDLRELRNSASHPKKQSIIMPKDALTILVWVAERVNTLFK
jgi:hypothetical protein